jgi:hypothetical protein
VERCLLVDVPPAHRETLFNLATVTLSRLVLATALLIAPACRTSPSATPASPGTVVRPDLARFEIPLTSGGGESWTWYDANTPDETLEYQWQVRVRGEPAHAFGYSLFKIPGAAPQRGDFAALLRAGQASVWRSDNDWRRMRATDAKPVVRIEDNRVIIELRDPAVIREVFAARPAEVEIMTQTPSRGPESVFVPVTYRGF